MTKPEEEGTFFITEEIEAEMRAAGYVFDVPNRIYISPENWAEMRAELAEKAAKGKTRNG